MSQTKIKGPSPSKKAAAPKKATAPKKAAPKKAAPTKAAPKKAAPKKAAPKAQARPVAKRADFGAPIDTFFAKQPEKHLPLLHELRAMVEAAAPDAESSLKWGMPVFSIDGTMVCAIGAHKAHVNLILSGPAGTFPDPDGLLQGEGATGRHLKLTKSEDLPRAAVKKWLAIAVARARG